MNTPGAAASPANADYNLRTHPFPSLGPPGHRKSLIPAYPRWKLPGLPWEGRAIHRNAWQDLIHLSWQESGKNQNNGLQRCQTMNYKRIAGAKLLKMESRV